MTPLIGVTSGSTLAKDGKTGTVSVGEAYIRAVLEAGGVPLILPVGINPRELHSVFSRLDGVLLTGGGDIDPGRFNGKTHLRVYGVDAQRDELEINLVRLAVENGKPFLGICRGIQVINVALGGSLFTHISDQLPNAIRHDYFPDIPRDHLAHSIVVSTNSRLANIMGGESFEVNSLHHQGIEYLAPSLRCVASSPDMLIEAVEFPRHKFGLGVQWHPECLQAYAPQRQLFQALVNASIEKH